jgi:hypothetical protein
VKISAKAQILFSNVDLIPKEVESIQSVIIFAHGIQSEKQA